MNDTDQMSYPAVVIFTGQMLVEVFDPLIAAVLMKWLLSTFTLPTTLAVEVEIGE
jgi:hypothetical protein